MKKKRRLINLIIMFIVSFAIFIGLLLVQKRLLAPNGTDKVYLAKNEIAQGTIIETKSDCEKYFITKTINKDDLVDGYITSESELIGKRVMTKIYKNEQITENRILDKNSILKDIIDPREIAIKGSDISETVGGTIKKGDLIDIDIIDKQTEQCVNVKHNVYVSSINNEDGLNINIIVDEKEQQVIKEKLSLGNLKLSKVLKDYTN